MATNLQKVMKTLRDASTTDCKALALTTFRRTYFDDAKTLKALKDEEISDLCMSLIHASITEDDKLYNEICRTLDVVLPETENKNFDFFQSILQINRKKRLKILISLSILKDETIAKVANKPSLIDFFNNCFQSIQQKSMTWLSPENADNEILLKNIENKNLNENEILEEKIIEYSLNLLGRLCNFSSLGLNARQFDTIIMDKVVPLAYMGYRKQRRAALISLQQAIKYDLGIRVRSIQREIWEKYKSTLQSVYCKRMTLLVNICDQDWATQWETSITLIGTDLHRGSGLVNSLLKVEELAFKSADTNRRQAFISWKLLIDNFALDQRELATSRRIKLLCVPLNAKNSKTELMVLTKMEVWWHLIYKVYPSIAECIDPVLIPFLNLCFGPFGDKPLFIHKTDGTVSLGKKFFKTQVFAIEAFIQLIVKNEDQTNITSSVEKLPNPISTSVFESIHKIFIYCFGEILLILADEDIKNKTHIYTVLWNSIIRRIEEYDKMKVLMYKEMMNVFKELLENRFYKKSMIREFFFNIVLQNFDNIANKMHFTEHILWDLKEAILQVDNFPYFTRDHYQSIETLMWHLIKPKDSHVYYPQTLEVMQQTINILDKAKKINTNMSAVCEIWCILAKISKQYADSQTINEGTFIQPNFNTIESIIAFPFMDIFIDDHTQLKTMAETWKDLYQQFDFQAQLIVSVQTNEILEKTSNMIIAALKKDKKCCDLASICVDALVNTANYTSLPSNKEVPAIVLLLKDLTFQCLRSNSFATERVLKALSAFLLRSFNRNVEISAQYLKIVEPTIKYMLVKVDDTSLEREITNTWSTIVGIFKNLQKSLNFELLTCYKKTLVLAMLHLNKEISSMAFSIIDLKDNVDEKSKKMLEDIMNDLKETSLKNNFEPAGTKEKSKKIQNIHVKTIDNFFIRKSMSPSSASSAMQKGKENMGKTKIVNEEPDSQDFVVINTDINLDVNRLTEHQKEMLKKRRDDIPAMYNELSVSNTQDSQELQRWFDTKSSKSLTPEKNQTTSNNNEVLKPTSESTLHFKNIAQTFNESPKTFDKPAKSVADALTVEPIKEVEEDTTIEDSQKKSETETASVVVKKLDFESREEFPENEEQVSPSIIDQPKMRRRIVIDDNNVSAQEKNVRTTRRSLQPLRGLRRFNSNEQLNKRGRKRRNSESNSEGMLNIEREKRPRRENTPDVLTTNTETNKNNEDKSTNSGDKKYSKRQLIEMSRLKIDMKFECLPSRRSLKLNETSANEKKTSIKDDKVKDDKSTSLFEIETNHQHQKRRSIKGSSTFMPKIDEKEAVNHKKENGNKKMVSENSETGKGRKSLRGNTETTLKKSEVVEETQEEVVIEDVSTPIDSATKPEDISVTNCSITEVDDNEVTEIASSQDSDIVESSQELNMNSKMNKSTKIVEEFANTEEKVIQETPVDANETSISIIPATVEPEKPEIQPETKKIESNLIQGKPAIPSSHSSSPKSSHSRLFRAKGFPLQNRAAQMLGLVTKHSIAEKLTMASEIDVTGTDELTIVPLPKKDKSIKEIERVSSPSSGASSRQVKMFNNMNNTLRQEQQRTFCNLRNNGERISPKLDKHDRDHDEGSKEIENEIISAPANESPNGKLKKELPLLEWSSANPPSLTASPSVSILKKQEVDIDTPNKKKRVSFADPPVSREMNYEILTESSSPPKLEKLPTNRSPIARKEIKRFSKLRLILTDYEKLEKENELANANNTEEKSIDSEVNDVVNDSNKVFNTEPDKKLSSVLTEIEELKNTEVEDSAIGHTEDVDMFVDNSNVLVVEGIEIAKTSTQNDQNNSSIKLESINLSNILQKSVSLEDTVVVENLSSSIESISNTTDIAAKTYSQCSADQADTLPVTDSVFSTHPLSQETQNSVAELIEPDKLDSTLPVYPSLISCSDAVDIVSADLVDPSFSCNIAEHLSLKSIRSVGDLAQLTERDINRLPIRRPKLSCVKKALSRYEEQLINKTPDRKLIKFVSSSTPLGNKRQDKVNSDHDSFEALIKNSSDTSDIGVLDLYEGKKPKKRHSTDNSVQTSPAKKSKKIDEESCLELMERCDYEFLVKAFVKILKGHKEKELKKGGLKRLGLSEENDSQASIKQSSTSTGLDTVLQVLPHAFDDNEEFIDTVLEIYKSRLRAETILNLFKPEEIKNAITNKFESSELLKMLVNNMLQENEMVINKALTDTNDLQTLLNRVPIETLIDHVSTRDELESESLLNIILENNTKKLTDNTKQLMFKILTEKIDICELSDMYNKAIKLKVQNLQRK